MRSRAAGVAARFSAMLRRLSPLAVLGAALWALALLCLAWAVVRLFGLERGYPLVPLIAYTPYAAIAAIGVGVAAACAQQRAAAVTAMLAAAVLVSGVAPRAVGGGAEVATGPGVPVRVMSVSLHRGLTSREDVVEL